MSIIEDIHAELHKLTISKEHTMNETHKAPKQLVLDGFGEPTRSIIITGKQGSGKTTKMDQLIGCIETKKHLKMYYRELKMFLESGLALQGDIFACDEITSPKQIQYLSEKIDQMGIVVIIATQLSYHELELVDTSKFHLIEL